EPAITRPGGDRLAGRRETNRHDVGMWECACRESHPRQVSAALAQRRRDVRMRRRDDEWRRRSRRSRRIDPATAKRARSGGESSDSHTNPRVREAVTNAPCASVATHYTDDEFDFAHAGQEKS